MPIYEYRCNGCQVPYTKSRGISEPEVIYSCDTCNIELTRVYSSVGVTFNGTGFYRTDSRGP